MSPATVTKSEQPTNRVLKSLLRPRRVAPRLAPGGGIVAAAPTAAAGGHFVDNGGLVLTNIHVWLVFWGTAWADAASPSAADITQAAQTILEGSYMEGLKQYRGIGPGRLAGALRVADTDPPNQFSDSNVAEMLHQQLERGSLPEPDEDPQILYCVIMPPGIDPAQANLLGEHSYFVYFDLTDLALPLDFDIGRAHYAWVANDGTLDSVTTVLSHEIAESATDPNGDGIQGTSGTCSQDGWCEIGDVCSSWSDFRDGVKVQSYWSERDGSCILPDATGGAAVAATHDAVSANTEVSAPGLWPRIRARYVGGLIASAWLPPILSTVVTVAEYVAPSSIPSWAQLIPDSPAVAGVVAGVASWLIFAAFFGVIASAQSANPGIYGELRERLGKLDAHLLALSRQDPSAEPHLEATQHRDYVASELKSTGPRWVLATGYINLWRRMHRAEESLIEIKPVQQVAEDAQHDLLRMTDSTMSHSADMIAKLSDAAEFLTVGLAGSTPPATCTVKSEAEARGVVRAIRYTVNDFRDQRWAGLVRARNLLILTTLLTEAFAFSLLALAIVEKAPASGIVAGIVFFLVGATLGLFNRVSQAAATGTIVEDYSLASVRAILTPIVSGLAAIGGVVLTGMVTMSGLTGLVQPGTGTGATASAVALPALSDIFDLDKFRIGLLLAALFGLTPSLLINRLQQLTDKYKHDLNSTEPAVSAQGTTTSQQS